MQSIMLHHGVSSVLLQINGERQAQIDRAIREKRAVEAELEKVDSWNCLIITHNCSHL